MRRDEAAGAENSPENTGFVNFTKSTIKHVRLFQGLYRAVEPVRPSCANAAAWRGLVYGLVGDGDGGGGEAGWDDGEEEEESGVRDARDDICFVRE